MPSTPMPEDDALLQVIAGVRFMQMSHLMNYSNGDFEATESTTFEDFWHKLDRLLGQAACWNIFSTGAECFLKGILLSNGITEFVKDNKTKVFEYPPTKFDEKITLDWASSVFAGKISPEVMVKDFSTLGAVIVRNEESPLSKLFKSRDAKDKEKALVFAAFTLLAKNIRNRDTHAYIPNVRQQHFFLVKNLFAPAFNLCASWYPNGGKAAIAKYWEESSNWGTYSAESIPDIYLK